MRNETLLHEAIKDGFEHLKRLDPGSEEYRTLADVLTKFMDRSIKIEEITLDNQEKTDIRVNDTDLKLKQMRDETIDRWARHIMTGLGIAVPVLAASYWSWVSMAFEKEDTITNTAGKKHLNWLLSIKK